MAWISPGFNSPRVHPVYFFFWRVGRTANALVSKTSGRNPLQVRILHPPHKINMFNFFKKTKKEPKSLKEVFSQFKNLEKDFKKLFEEVEGLKKNYSFSVQKVGVIRFNPFREVGGDQSFSVALLDGTDSGIVITSFYTREGNRVYGKPIRNGLSEYSLSEEEKGAIEKAKSSIR